MPSDYYKKCKELDICCELIDKYWNKKEYVKCFEGHLKLALETSYPLAECQVGYFYLEGIGCEKDLEKAFYWTQKAAIDGDRDGQYNLAMMYEEGIGTNTNIEKAIEWYKSSASQNHDLAIEKCKKNI